MGLFDFFRNMRKKRKIEDTGIERSLPQTLDGFDPNAVTPPDTRYTQEYQDFLAAQEAGGQNRELSGTAGAESPAGETPEEYAEETPPCAACGEAEEPAEGPEGESGESCEVPEEAAEEAGSDAGAEIPAEEETLEEAAEEVPPCAACGEAAAPAEEPEGEPGESCEALEESAEEAASEEENTEDIPAGTAAPEADDIVGNE